jgi:NAD(P)-dependent dehydrogenase (short-subunit alcohol dehydrogenase family)
MDLDLNGKKVIVSGGSRGIGRAIVEAFLAEGAIVAFCARDAAGVARAQGELGPGSFGSALDVTDTAAMQDWVEGATQAMGGIDIVVPNVSALAGAAIWPYGARRWKPICWARCRWCRRRCPRCAGRGPDQSC